VTTRTRRLIVTGALLLMLLVALAWGLPR